ncbi:MAG: DEAD/DEAH box helicase [[Clostridium] fimetarium]|nr:DEAD/DEAH box helicase [Alistipes timonensis]MCM1405463.1 DEAD/DEAH box helicase [[Clostridium] fimetarium]
MDTKTITERLRERHNINVLNDMQQLMASTEADRVILLAPTGSGKTAAFALRLLRALGPSDGKRVQAVVMAPSRELVIQIADVLRPVAAGLKTVAFYGGHNMADEVKSLSPLPDIIVATPGRLLDHLLRRNLDLATCDALVLDEYDKSLELGFYDEMKRIVGRMKKLKLIILTSATKLAEMPDFLNMGRNPEVIDFTRQGAKSRLQTVMVPSPAKDKLSTLDELLRSLPDGKAVVFVNHRESAERVFSHLKEEGFPAGLYHGGLEQRERKLAVDLLNNGTTPILVSTDLGARGLDIDSVNYVIHYHLPLSPESWTHRNGRTARQGAEGTAYLIVNEEESIPEYVNWDHEYHPRSVSDNGIRSEVATLYINAGKKERISKGDVAGYVMQRGGLTKEEVGKIIVDDHSSIVAVPRAKAGKVLELLAPHKLKNTRVRVSLLK